MINDYELNPHLIACSAMAIANNPVPGIRFPGRVVRWYEFELITDTDQGYIINIDHRINAKKGLLMIRKPGSVVNGVSSYACLSIAFDSLFNRHLEPYYAQPMFTNATVDILNEMSNQRSSFLESLPEAIQLSNDTTIKSLLEEAMDLSLKGAGASNKPIKGKQLLYAIFDEISKELDLQNNKKFHNAHNSYDVIISTKEWMDIHYAQAISLQSLANRIGYSKEAYCRLFKQITQQSPIDYLISIRILNAKKRLMITNDPISLIAYKCGFKNDTHFYTSFKQREDISPGSYRDLHKRH